VPDIRYFCRHCGTHTTSPTLASAKYATTDDSERYQLDYLYTLVKCSACSDISLLLTALFDDYDADSVYPAAPRSMGSAVPSTVQRCFEEARICYQARAYTASAIMCRRTLETLALDRGADAGNLAKSLTNLKDRGDIDQRLFDWSDALRLAGNSAAHDVAASISRVDASDMNDLTEAVIDYVYVFQERYQSFKNRRAGQAE
jgi:hypothetical protein